ncbi:MAG: nitrilase family protein [Bacteroidia bacterium]|nr:nitrilase family protein [Bacteroidia bacterium]
MPSLKVAILQYNISWKNKAENFNKIKEMISEIDAELVVLPEMFQTGFCIDDKLIAETMEGETIQFLKAESKAKGISFCGSFLCVDNNSYFNRFVMVSDGDVVGHYDKVHLFGLGGETAFIEAGNTKVDFAFRDFKIRPMVCYDLRFPYLSFNDSEYDLLICVANWPSQRIAHWDALLKARSIENQVYVIASNRVGEVDGHFYPGHSCAYKPNGELLVHSHKEEVIQFEISKEEVTKTREKHPFIKDRKM